MINRRITHQAPPRSPSGTTLFESSVSAEKYVRPLDRVKPYQHRATHDASAAGSGTRRSRGHRDSSTTFWRPRKWQAQTLEPGSPGRTPELRRQPTHISMSTVASRAGSARSRRQPRSSNHPCPRIIIALLTGFSRISATTHDASAAGSGTRRSHGHRGLLDNVIGSHASRARTPRAQAAPRRTPELSVANPRISA